VGRDQIRHGFVCLELTLGHWHQVLHFPFLVPRSLRTHPHDIHDGHVQDLGEVTSYPDVL
jgi:hypothetical protein